MFDGFKDSSEVQELVENGNKEISQSSQYLFDKLMGDAPFGKADNESDEFGNNDYEFIIKDLYEEVYGRDEDDFSFEKFDLSNPELNDSLMVFSDDKWESLDTYEKKLALVNYEKKLSKVLDLRNPPKIEFFQGKPRECGSYDRRNNIIRVNETHLNDTKLIVNTIAHETWHAYQYQCAENPKTRQDMLYAINFKKYVSPIEYEGKWLLFDEYESQLVEAEARAFGNLLADKVGVR